MKRSLIRCAIAANLALALAIALAGGCSATESSAPQSEPTAPGAKTDVQQPPPLQATSCAMKHAEPLRIGTEGDYPPFNDVDDAGNFVGWEVVFARDWLCQQLDRECVFSAHAWGTLEEGIFPDLVAGKFDLLVASALAKPEREALGIDFGLPYYATEHRFIVRFDNHDFDPEAADRLAGKKIAVQEGTAWVEVLQQHYAAELVLADSNETARQTVLGGEADAYMTTPITVPEELLQGTGGADPPLKIVGDRDIFEATNTPDPGSAAGVRRGDQALLAAVNCAIERLFTTADGQRFWDERLNNTPRFQRGIRKPPMWSRGESR